MLKTQVLEAAVEETNEHGPDLVVVAGDLTMSGYRSEFEEAKGYLDRLECENVVVAMGNHDAKNVGYRHFEDLFGVREGARTVPTSEGEAKVVTVDSTQPDLDEGQVGREHYGWIDSEFRGWEAGPKIFVVHHHFFAVPGTGRDTGVLRDAGEVMAILESLEVDIVLAGHRHVPYLWNVSGVRVIHSGTVSSERTRGFIPPSYNLIELGPEEARVIMRKPGEDEELLATFARDPVRTSELHQPLELFVSYYETPSHRG